MLKNLSYLLSLVLVIASAQSIACDIEGKTGFLPENNLKRSVNAKNGSNMTEERFNEIIDKADAHYAPIVKDMGGKLKWGRKWSTETVNANASRGWFGSWKVNMYGGLARHELVTDDAFAMVVCHELGHHIGGAPKVGGAMAWAANEGQSDYFGTLKCFRRIYESENNIAAVEKMIIPAIVTEKCSASFTAANDVALCERSAMAGQSLSNLLGSLRSSGLTKFETPDTTVVNSTNNKHPAAQCRLDTYFAGALCDKRLNDDVSNTDATIGTCNSSTGETVGVRPSCWYKEVE